jgi:ankyrin repeat protein
MDPELATLLVTEAASHINARTVNGSTPLYIAASYHNHEADPKALLIKRYVQCHPAHNQMPSRPLPQ